MSIDIDQILPCSCEDMSHGNLGEVQSVERLARILSPLHFDKKGRLKPSAFAITHLQEAGLSLVRVDKIDAAEIIAVASDIMKSSDQMELRGALVGSAQAIRDAKLPDGHRALCVKDDPVLGDKLLRDNEAHAVSVATRRVTEEDMKEVRMAIWGKFSPISNLSDIYSKL